MGKRETERRENNTKEAFRDGQWEHGAKFEHTDKGKIKRGTENADMHSERTGVHGRHKQVMRQGLCGRSIRVQTDALKQLGCTGLSEPWS